MLTSDLEWVRANELSINKSRLKVGLHYPCIDIESEIKECKGWSFDHPGVNVYADTIPNYLRGMAFMRVLGRMITDTRVHNDHMIFYHRSDVQSFLDDLGYFCARKSVYDNGDHYIIMLPSDFVNIIEDIEGIGTISFPCFVFAEDFPRPLLREFLGGMFGGDGQTCSLEKRDVLTSVSLSKSSTNVDSLVKIMENVKTLLSRCGIENITIDNSIHEKTTTHYRSTLHLDISELLPFWENIGFRYCAHKSLCLEAGASYARLQEVVTKQHHWILHRVDEIMNRSKTRTIDHDMIVDTDRVIRQAVDELSNNESLHRYAIPKVHGVTVDTASFPNAGEFLKHVGAYHWFTDTSIRRDDVLPTMEMTVIGVRPYGLEKVYDIEVEDINSFLANGIVAHNCMISHGVSRFLTERLYDMSDKFTIHVCRKCGSVPDDLNTCHICEDLD
ncbi:MAG: hypothetical protein EBV19_09570, partial [Flavobacteriia bacterium]|nr:hypothetical protein [Flavobacteriia bacterium]